MTHKYLKIITRMQQEGALPRMSVATVSHDGWCLIYKGGACNCNPHVKVQAVARPNRSERRKKGRKS